MIKAVIFDLDDTLYMESEFFRGGFAAAANELEARGVGQAPLLAEMLMTIYRNEGRELVFSKAAERIPFPQEWVPEMVEIFRSHWPRIRPARDVPETLRMLGRHYRLGCVTDGFAEVQRRKIEALGVAPLLDTIVVADELGRDCWKPNPLPFQVCCQRLGVDASEAVVVGDNPERDVRGARNAGMPVVRIMRDGAYFSESADAGGDEADYEIRSLRELENTLLELEHRRSSYEHN